MRARRVAEPGAYGLGHGSSSAQSNVFADADAFKRALQRQYRDVTTPAVPGVIIEAIVDATLLQRACCALGVAQLSRAVTASSKAASAGSGACVRNLRPISTRLCRRSSRSFSVTPKRTRQPLMNISIA
jgi:hypothetical protein